MVKMTDKTCMSGFEYLTYKHRNSILNNIM